MTDTAPNIDASEIHKFEAIASRWWDPASEFKPLHDINPLRLGYVQSHVKLAGKTVVDVGCGGGILAESMATAGADVLGIDMGEEPLRVAELHTLETGVAVEYRQITAEALADELPGAFDVVTCMEMLEHVPDPGSVVAACARLVRPGGHVFFSTLNRNPKSWLFAIVGAEYMLNLLPRGTHDYGRFIRPAELDRWVRATELRTVELTGLSYNPLTRAYRLAPQDISVNYMAACRRPARG